MGTEYLGQHFRLNFAAHHGTYPIDNYASEPAVLRSIYKAYLGFRLNRKKNAWLDLGVFPSYIGFEGVSAFDNATLSRSLLAENSPYFLSGIRGNFPVNKNDEISIYILTGWQRIVPQSKNSIPAFGYQWVHNFKQNSKINWSFWAGSDHPDSTRKWRFFNNLYWQGKQGKWAYTLGFDLGVEQKSKGSNEFYTWYAPVVITQYSMNDKWRAAFRLERYADPNSVVARPAHSSAALVNSQSVNIDFMPRTNFLCRLEWRLLQNRDPLFYKQDRYSDHLNYFTASIAYQFSKTLGKSNMSN